MCSSRFVSGAALLAVCMLTACQTPASIPASSTVPPEAISTSPVPPPSSPSPTTESPVEPSATPNLIRNPTLTITGEEEIVFDWSADHCEDYNIPDLAARAFRDAGGQTHLIIANLRTYQMLGPDLNSVVIDCSQPVLTSDYQLDGGKYDDSEWLASPYTEDGQTVYALVHNEYRGLGYFGPCPSGPFENCLDTSITLAVSTDGGMTYTHAADPPAHLVATLPYQQQVGKGPFGTRNPSNIIKGQDGYYYAFSNVSTYETQEQWVCAMRTDDLSDAASWRFWDGRDFAGEFLNPYLESNFSIDFHLCQPMAWSDIGASLNESITWNTYLNRYVLIGNSADRIGGQEVWGWYYAFSDDLVNWSHRELLLEVELPWTVDDPANGLSYLYPTLLDPDSESRNFETTGQTAYLYVTRMNFGPASLDRDLIRYPVEFGGD